MYNRYIPQPDGSYHRRSIPDRPSPPRQRQPSEKMTASVPDNEGASVETVNSKPSPRQDTKPLEGNIFSFFRHLLPSNLDTGDLLVIILLLLMAGDNREDQNSALLTLVLYLFL